MHRFKDRSSLGAGLEEGIIVSAYGGDILL